MSFDDFAIALARCGATGCRPSLTIVGHDDRCRGGAGDDCDRHRRRSRDRRSDPRRGNEPDRGHRRQLQGEVDRRFRRRRRRTVGCASSAERHASALDRARGRTLALRLSAIVEPDAARLIPKTIRWRSTIIQRRVNGWATAKPGSARRRRSPPTTPMRSAAISGVQYVAEGLHQNVHVVAGRQALVHASPRHRPAAAADPPRLDVPQRPLLQWQRAVARRSGGRARHGRRRSAVRRRESRRTGRLDLEAAVPRGRRRDDTSWMVAPAPGDDQFDAVYMPFTHRSPAAESGQAERHHRSPRRPPARCRGS